MTKLVTCTAALILYERGAFLLNDPLEEYLPEFRDSQVYRTAVDGTRYVSPARNPILVKDLFKMSSGLTYPGESCETERRIAAAVQALEKDETDRKKYTIRALSRALAQVPLAFDPGTRWWYSLSHDVLGALIEVLSGKGFGEFLQNEIFGPLQMEHTFFRLQGNRKDFLCTLYERQENGILCPTDSYDGQYQADCLLESGGAGLLSTLGDYTRFVGMLAGKGTLNGTRILGSNTVQLMATPHFTKEQLANAHWSFKPGYSYGLGVRVAVNPTEGGFNAPVGEFGWAGMLGTYVTIDMKDNLAAVYMQQSLPTMESYIQPRIRNIVYASII